MFYIKGSPFSDELRILQKLTLTCNRYSYHNTIWISIPAVRKEIYMSSMKFNTVRMKFNTVGMKFYTVRMKLLSNGWTCLHILRFLTQHIVSYKIWTGCVFSKHFHFINQLLKNKYLFRTTGVQIALINSGGANYRSLSWGNMFCYILQHVLLSNELIPIGERTNKYRS